MKKLLSLSLVVLCTISFGQTCNKLNHNCSNTVGLNTTGISSNGGSTLACTLADNVLYSSSSSDPYIATDDIFINQGMAATLHFDAKRASGYFGTGEVWVHIGGYCNFSVYDFPFNDNGWVQIGTFNPNTTCSQFGPYTVPSDMAGGQNISYCIVLKGASSTNFVSIDNICVSEISGSFVPSTMDEDFGTSSSGWYPNVGVDDIPYHTYKNASDAYTILGTGVDGFPDKAAYFYTGFDFCSTVSGVGVVTKEINTSSYTNGEVRIEFKSKYPCSGSNSYTFDENYQSYSPEISVMSGPDNGSNTWTELPVNYYFADYNWRVASYDISAYKNSNIRIKVERGGFCGTSMEAIDNIRVIDRDCSISLESCGTISGEAAPLQNTDYPYTVPAVTGATYYKWYVRHEGTLYDTAPYIVSGQGTQNVSINFQSLPSSGVRVLCIPFDTDPAGDENACYAEIGILGVTVSASTPLVFDSIDSVDVSCNGANDGSITVNVSGGQPAYTYSWVPNVSTTNSASGLSPGVYEVTVTDQNSDQIVETITIEEPNALVVTLPVDIEICDGQDTLIDAAVMGGTSPYVYSWTPVTDLSSSSIEDPIASPSSNTTYTLQVTDDNSCTDADDILITVNALPNVAFTADVLSGCPPLDVNFTNTSAPTGDNCTWDFGDGNTANTCGNPLNTFVNSGFYDVSLTVTSVEGCTAGIVQSNFIEVFEIPGVGAGNDTTVCEGELATLTADNPDAATISWDNGVTDAAAFTPTATMDYIVTASNTNCSNTDTVTVTVQPFPMVDLGVDTSLCDTILTLDAGAGNDSYNWSTSETSQQIDANASGVYDVTVSLNGCESSDTISVTLNTPPVIDLGPDTTFCDESYVIDAGAGYDSYSWSSGETTQSLEVFSTGTYTVTVELNGCFATDSIFVERLDCTGIVEINGNEIKMYPNPTDGEVTISGLPEGYTISVQSMDGKVLQKLHSEVGNDVIDLSAQPDGTYIIQFWNDSTRSQLRLIKQ